MRRVALLVSIALLSAGAVAVAGEYEGKAEGPFISVDVIDVKAYGGPAYLEYLGKGYIPMLEKAKAAGQVVDYGVLQYITGSAGDGNVVIWWATASMADMEAAGKTMEKAAEAMRTPEEWKAMTDAMAKVRTPLSTNIARGVVWTKKEATGGGDGGDGSDGGGDDDGGDGDDGG